MRKSTPFSTLLLSLLGLTTSTALWAATQPIPGIGIVVKKNPGGSASKFITEKDGSLSIKLEAGEYTLSLDDTTLASTVNSAVKSAYPCSTYQYDNTVWEATLKDGNHKKEAKYSMAENKVKRNPDDKPPSLNFTVPEGGETISVKVNIQDVGSSQKVLGSSNLIFKYLDPATPMPYVDTSSGVMSLPVVELPSPAGSVYYQADFKLIPSETDVIYELTGATQIKASGTGYPTYEGTTGNLIIPSLFQKAPFSMTNHQLSFSLLPNEGPLRFVLNSSDYGACQGSIGQAAPTPTPAPTPVPIRVPTPSPTNPNPSPITNVPVSAAE